MAMIAKGSFEVTMHAEPPYDAADGVTLARASFDKRFAGPLDATSTVQMLAARTPVDDSAGYVALERIQGTLEGRRGAFVVVHTGIMNRGARSLTIAVVPDSGTGELRGIAGTMSVEIVEGRHSYELEYSLASG
jgi:Protein of unknown function (DUF3224)